MNDAQKRFEQAILEHKESGNEWFELDLDEQQRLCALRALTWTTSEQYDALEKVEARQVLAFIASDNLSVSRQRYEAIGEYVASKVLEYMEAGTEAEYNDYIIEDDGDVDAKTDRLMQGDR